MTIYELYKLSNKFMLPIILCSQSEKDIEHYLQKFVQTQSIQTTHIFKFVPEKSELSMDEVRSILKLFSIQYPAERVFIFYRFGNTSWEVQNMLLKVLEEKKESNHIFLITSNLYSLLPTIRSRAKIVKIENNDHLYKKNIEIPPLLDFMSNDKKRNPLFHEQLINVKKEDALKYIDEFIFYFANKLKACPIRHSGLPLRHSGPPCRLPVGRQIEAGTTSDCPESMDPGVIPHSGIPQDDAIPEILKHIFFIKNKIENNNLNVSLAIDNLLLFIEKKVTINK